MDAERQLATIRTIDAIAAIDGADAIETAWVGGWAVVVKKGEYRVGDEAVYLEIDSWVPTSLAAFLSKGKEPREYEGVKGERLRTVKLRGQISQGLLLTRDQALPGTNSFVVGDDVTEHLGIKKWEKPMNAQLAGMAKGNFPSFIRKTDQPRVQNIRDYSDLYGNLYQVTEKLDGSSMTVYLREGVFGVCSRNLDLKETEGNTFWEVARTLDLENKMRALGMDNMALQGELCGPGIQGNAYKLSKPDFFLFDIFDINSQTYMNPRTAWTSASSLRIRHVPVLDDVALNTCRVDLIEQADGRSALADTAREGVVFKHYGSEDSFKVISNKWLLKNE